MLKKTINYEDLDGNPVTEDFYFNLSKAEMAEMQFSEAGGFMALLQSAANTSNPSDVIPMFRKILAMAVGQRSLDGKRFIKSQDIIDSFLQTDAYSVMLMEILSDTNAAVEFVKGVIPADLVGKVELEMLAPKVIDVELPGTDVEPEKTDGVEKQPHVVPAGKSHLDYTAEDLRTISYEEFLVFDKYVSKDLGRLPKDALVVIMQRRASGK